MKWRRNNTDKLFRITTLDNYRGTLFGKIGIGTSEKERLEAEPSFINEFEEVWESKKLYCFIRYCTGNIKPEEAFMPRPAQGD